MVVHLLESKEIIVEDKENVLVDKTMRIEDDCIIPIRKIHIINGENKEEEIAFTSFNDISKKIINGIFNEIHTQQMKINELKKQNEEICLKNYRLDNKHQKLLDELHESSFWKRLRYLFTKRI